MDILTDRLPYDENWWTGKDIEMRVDGDKMGHRRISIEGVVAALQCFVVDGETRGNPLLVDTVTGVYEHLKVGQRNARNASQPLAVFSVSDDAIQSHAITFLVAVVHVLLDAETHQEPSDTPHIQIHVSRYSIAILTTAHHMLHVKDMLVSSLPYVTGWFAEHRTPSPTVLSSPSWEPKPGSPRRSYTHFSLPTGTATLLRPSISPPEQRKVVSIHESKNRVHPAETNSPKPTARRETKGIPTVALFAYGTDVGSINQVTGWLKEEGPHEIQTVQPQDPPFFGVWQADGQTPKFDVIVQFEKPPDALKLLTNRGPYTANTFFQQYIRSIIVKLKPNGLFYASTIICQRWGNKGFDSIHPIVREPFRKWTREQLMQAAANNVETHYYPDMIDLVQERKPHVACRDCVSEEMVRSLDGELHINLISFFLNQCVTTWWPGNGEVTMLNNNAIVWDQWIRDLDNFKTNLIALPNDCVIPVYSRKHWFGCLSVKTQKNTQA